MDGLVTVDGTVTVDKAAVLFTTTSCGLFGSIVSAVTEFSTNCWLLFKFFNLVIES